MTTNLKELAKYLNHQGMENLLDSIKMSQLTDSSAEHLFGEIAKMDDSQALIVERLASMKRILSDQRFISKHTIVMCTTMAIKGSLQN